MKRFEITYMMSFELPAPNITVVLDDVNRIIARELGIYCSMIDINVREKDPSEDINSITDSPTEQND